MFDCSINIIGYLFHMNFAFWMQFILYSMQYLDVISLQPYISITTMIIFLMLDVVLNKKNCLICSAVRDSVKLFNRVENGYRNDFKCRKSVITSLLSLVGIVLLTFVGIRICALCCIQELLSPQPIIWFANSYSYTINTLCVTASINMFINCIPTIFAGYWRS